MEEPEEEQYEEEQAEEDEAGVSDEFAADESEDDEDYESDEDLPEVFDLADVPDEPERVLIPAGTYDATIEEVNYELSKTSNNPMLTWVLKIRDKDGNDFPGRLFFHTTLAGDGFSRTKRTLLRVDPELDLKNFRPRDCNDAYSGMDVRAKIRIEPPRGGYGKRNGVVELYSAEPYQE